MVGTLLVLVAIAAVSVAAVAVARSRRTRERMPAARPRLAQTLSLFALGLAAALGVAWAVTADDAAGPLLLVLAWPVVAAALPALSASRPRVARPLAWLGGLSLLAHVALFGLGFGLTYLLPAVLLLGAAIAFSQDVQPSGVTGGSTARPGAT